MTPPSILRLIVALAALLCCAPAQAGHRYCGRTYQTLKSSYGWSQSQGCYSCHQTSAQSYTHQRYQGGDVANILGGLAKKKTEYQALLDGLDKLGFGPRGGGNYQITNGSYTEGYGNLAQQGQTIYANVPHIDVMALGAMTERLASQAQGYAASATQGAQDLVGQAQRVAEIQAAGQAASAALQAAGSAAGPSFRQFNFQASTGQSSASQGGVLAPDPPAGADPQPAAGGANSFAAILQASCVSCHSPDKKSGGLDLTTLDSLAAEDRGAILAESFRRVILPKSDDEHMPKGKPELSLPEKAAFAVEASLGPNQ